ncbi:unnamed protein product [Rotaria socialis]|uniref:Uncharacterized protein n=1 Tax=Rotaria socialis TaxID=392032 RepID=A0A818DGD2_9BILA|nr:unnamed protein product [Rotaria socialis]CAF3339031.1 unnamed protein product [Rotaria socialis]CAF3442806.1 unnamed protein product [Rotaria socialis]CAF4543571.1 unnamed protein product [Rotaria socialis]CAF4575451.1 unnamed protein product [Rotaria socialis]
MSFFKNLIDKIEGDKGDHHSHGHRSQQGSNNFDEDYQGEYHGEAPFQVPPRENPYSRQGISEPHKSEDSYGQPDYNEREGFSREFDNESQSPRRFEENKRENHNREEYGYDREDRNPERYGNDDKVDRNYNEEYRGEPSDSREEQKYNREYNQEHRREENSWRD